MESCIERVPFQTQACLSTGIFLDENCGDQGRKSHGRQHAAAGSERQLQHRLTGWNWASILSHGKPSLRSASTLDQYVSGVRRDDGGIEWKFSRKRQIGPG